MIGGTRQVQDVSHESTLLVASVPRKCLASFQPQAGSPALVYCSGRGDLGVDAFIDLSLDAGAV